MQKVEEEEAWKNIPQCGEQKASRMRKPGAVTSKRCYKEC